MAPFGIFGNSGRGPSKQTLNNIRAKQDAARRADKGLHSEVPNTTAPDTVTATDRKSSMPQREGWSLSDTPIRRERDMPPAAQSNADSFKENISQGYSPMGAAKLMGPGTVPKPLKASNGQWEIRLNQHHRLTYRVDSQTKVLTILEIGGHT